MILSHRKAFIFFANARTATTSIEWALRPYDESADVVRKLALLQRRDGSMVCPNLKHIRPLFVKRILGEEAWNRYLKFVFVRNPWDWVISQFCWNHGRTLGGIERFESAHFLSHWTKMRRYRGFRDHKTYYQHPWVFDPDGERIVDFYGRFERLQRDFDHICDLIGLRRTRLSHTNRTERRGYRDCYTPKTQELVAEEYEQDIRLFRYEF